MYKHTVYVHILEFANMYNLARVQRTLRVRNRYTRIHSGKMEAQFSRGSRVTSRAVAFSFSANKSRLVLWTNFRTKFRSIYATRSNEFFFSNLSYDYTLTIVKI